MSPCAASPDDAASDGGAGCWICLDAGDGPLITPCACPHPVHPRCLARWQLQQAGRPEERACRFCGGCYPDWRAVLLPPNPAARLGPLAAVGFGPEAGNGLHDYGAAPVTMAISADGSVHHLQMLAGPSGKALFRAQVAALLGYGPDDEFEVVFECRLPLTGARGAGLGRLARGFRSCVGEADQAWVWVMHAAVNHNHHLPSHTITVGIPSPCLGRRQKGAPAWLWRLRRRPRLRCRLGRPAPRAAPAARPPAFARG
jgi:hypothetical protein